MSPRRRTLGQRIKDHLGFSLVAILILFIVLRLFGVRSTVASFFFSVLLTIGLNVGLSYYYDHRAAKGRRPRPDGRGGDIRWAEDDHRPRGRDGFDDRDRYGTRGRDADRERFDDRDRYDDRDRDGDRYDDRRFEDTRYDDRRHGDRRLDPRDEREPRWSREDEEGRRG